MKRLIAFIVCLFCGIHGVIFASTLVKVTKVETKDIVQLYFSFDTTPEFSTNSNQKRIDLIFKHTDKADTFSLFEPDKNIVKILSHSKKDTFILSLFFRYKPQTHKITLSSDEKIVFEILLGNQYSKSYKNLASRLNGLTVLDRPPVDFTNPLTTSLYKNDWMSFFSQYESPITISVPVKFTMPPFPIIRLLRPGLENNMQILTADLFELADIKSWDQLSQHLLKLIESETDLEKKKMLALTYGETLARGGHFSGAYKQLYLLKEKYKDELIGTYAQYLLINLRSIHESQYIANYEYQELELTLSTKTPLAPYFLLSRIETALATSQFDRLNILLQKDTIPLPQTVENTIQIRQADYWYAIQQSIKAYARYSLVSQSSLLLSMPYSQNGLCSTLYTQKKYKEAASCYEKLANIVSDKNLLGLISYRKFMSMLKFEPQSSLISKFTQIENAFIGTEAGFRAALKKNDLYFLQDQNWGKTAIKNYSAIAEKSLLRSTIEEALFKEALVFAQLNENLKAIKLLQKLLREFQKGDIRNSAQALLIDLLPDEIKRMVDNNEYMQALVLAKKHRILFQHNWINNTFLVDIAEAYHKIGVFDEAQRLYLYLIEISPAGQRENFYLPMIDATFAHGNYSLVDDYAAQYFYNYPDGKFTSQVQFIRLQALVADERIQDALAILPNPLPEDKKILEIAAFLYFRTDNYSLCLSSLQKLLKLEPSLTGNLQFMLAECYYKTQSFEEAKKIFALIPPDNVFYAQSLFRLAELERKKGNEQKALSIFEKIVEKGNSPLWQQYARRELEYAKAATRM